MRISRIKAIAAIIIAGIVAIGISSACKARGRVKSKLRAGDAAEDLASQCRQILESNRPEDGSTYSEEDIYRAIFMTLEKQPAPIDPDGEALAAALVDQFLVMADARASEGRRGGGVKLAPARKLAFANLIRSYIALLGPEVYAGYAQRTAEQQSYFERNPVGKWTNILREGWTAAYYSGVLNYMGALQKNRGGSITDLLMLYALDTYPDVFLVDGMTRSAAQAGQTGFSAQTAGILLQNKTTPALACNNYAASVVAEKIPWDKLGMESYEGWGYVPWFHGPIAQFRYEYPVVSSIIPVLGSSFAAADSLITLSEGRDANGDPAGRLQASAQFAFFFTMAVIDVYSVKAVAQETKNFLGRVSNRIRGIDNSVDGLKTVQAVIKDEAMRADSAARPLIGRNLEPCQLISSIDWFSLGGTAYAGGGLPCLRAIQNPGPLHQNISNAQRIDVIRDVNIADVMSAPGHQYLRDPNKVLELADYIAKTGGKGFETEPIVINVFTNSAQDGSVVVRSVEVMDGNHRFAAGLLSGKWQKISDIPPEYLKVKVNGWSAGGGFSEPRWIPLDVAQKSSIPRQSWFRVPDSWEGVKGPTAQIPGDIASVDSVISAEYRGVQMGQVLKTSLERVNAPIPEWLK